VRRPADGWWCEGGVGMGRTYLGAEGSSGHAQQRQQQRRGASQHRPRRAGFDLGLARREPRQGDGFQSRESCSCSARAVRAGKSSVAHPLCPHVARYRLRRCAPRCQHTPCSDISSGERHHHSNWRAAASHHRGPGRGQHRCPAGALRRSVRRVRACEGGQARG